MAAEIMAGVALMLSIVGLAWVALQFGKESKSVPKKLFEEHGHHACVQCGTHQDLPGAPEGVIALSTAEPSVCGCPVSWTGSAVVGGRGRVVHHRSDCPLSKPTQPSGSMTLGGGMDA